MLRVRRRCAQTAHISLHFHQFQTAWTQKPQNRQSLGASCNLVSRSRVAQRSRQTPSPSRLPFPAFASFRLPFRFGEAVSRPNTKHPQPPFLKLSHISVVETKFRQENKANEDPKFLRQAERKPKGEGGERGRRGPKATICRKSPPQR